MNAEEFTQLYELHRPKLTSIARRYSRDQWEDLLQNALLKAWRFRDRFEIDSRFDLWVGEIIKNQFLTDYHTAKRRGNQISLSHEDTKWVLNAQNLTTHQRSIDSFDDEIFEAFSQLPFGSQEMILLCDIEEIPQVELEMEGRLSKMQIKHRLRSGREKLSILLKDYGAERGYYRVEGNRQQRRSKKSKNFNKTNHTKPIQTGHHGFHNSFPAA
jgi:RNA polymerase sigma-70 factor, ECF subfamily